MVAVAGGGPRGDAVNLVVGDGDAVAGLVAEDDVLAADERGGDVVDPDHVDVVEGDGVAAPDVLRVELGDVDVLDDDVVDAADEAEPLALDDALVADADDGLVGADVDAQLGRVVVGHRHLGCVRLVVVAPVVLVDARLAPRGRAVGRAPFLRRGALGAGEVERLLQVDHPRARVGEVRDQLVDGLRRDGGGITAAGDALGETFRRAGHGGVGGAEEAGQRQGGL